MTGKRWSALRFYLANADRETDDCILWPHSRSKRTGHGQLWFEGRLEQVHVLACIRHHGPRPSGMVACHLPLVCHNGACFNGRHLMWDTPQANRDHMKLDGTNNEGERHPQAKLTEADVREIRARYAAGGLLQRELADEFGVTRRTIGDVCTRTWKHLTPITTTTEEHHGHSA